MDWRQIMGVKIEDEHFETYEQYPYNPQYSSSRDNITDITDITDKSEKVKNMSEEVRYWYEERAAICQYDGGLSREEAEDVARERQGYSIGLDGDNIQVKRKAGFSPDVEKVKILFQEIKAKKPVRYLKQRRLSVWCPYKGLQRWVSWDACLYHREMNDPACHECRPERRPQSQREEAETLARGGYISRKA